MSLWVVWQTPFLFLSSATEQQYFDIDKRLAESQEQIVSATKDLQALKEENKKLSELLTPFMWSWFYLLKKKKKKFISNVSFHWIDLIYTIDWLEPPVSWLSALPRFFQAPDYIYSSITWISVSCYLTTCGWSPNVTSTLGELVNKIQQRVNPQNRLNLSKFAGLLLHFYYITIHDFMLFIPNPSYNPM